MADDRVKRVVALAGVESKHASTATQPNAWLKDTVGAAAPHLLGADDARRAEVSSWLDFASDIATWAGSAAELQEKLNTVNDVFLSKTFCAGETFTVADAALFDALVGALHTKQPTQASSSSAAAPAAPSTCPFSTMTNLARYVKLIANLTKGRNGCQNQCKRGSPTIFPLKAAIQPAVAAAAAAQPAAAPAAEKAPAAAATKTEGGDNSKDKKKDKKEKGAAAPAAAKEAATPAPAADLDPSRLDIRVGRIVKCWDHPESTKLLCEEVDMGEGEGGGVRTITSGLRDHYTAAEMVDKHVVVICNLKERTMAGFKSQGMVMCAVAPEHKDVKLLVAPAGAVAGDRITFPGFNAANEPPMAPNQVAKKKILEGLLPLFRMDMAKGEATWRDVPFTVVHGKDKDAPVVGVVKTAAPVDPANGLYAIS